MALIPVQPKWTIYVKRLSGEKLSLTMEKNTSVRKMYRQVRKALRVTSAIKLVLSTGQQERDIPKSDERIDKIGISNFCELYVVVLKDPDTFKVTINDLPSIGNKVIYMTEDKPITALYTEVKKLIAAHNKTEKLLNIQLMYSELAIEENSSLLRGEIFDGVELEARLLPITVVATVGNKSYTINISPNATPSEFFQEVRTIAPALNNNKQLRLMFGQTELREDSDTTLYREGIHHGTTVFPIFRAPGGSDPYELLQSFPN